jgi:hypothetical protein
MEVNGSFIREADRYKLANKTKIVHFIAAETETSDIVYMHVTYRNDSD